MRECKKCGWKWRERVDKPKRCARCGKYEWDSEPPYNRTVENEPKKKERIY